MPSVGFEPTIPADERPQTYALDRAVTGTGHEDISNKWAIVLTLHLTCLHDS